MQVTVYSVRNKQVYKGCYPMNVCWVMAFLLAQDSTGSPQSKATLAFRGRLVSLLVKRALRSLTVAFPPTGVSGGFGLLPVEPIS